MSAPSQRVGDRPGDAARLYHRLSSYTFSPGEVVFLCSDGLHSMITDPEITKAITPFPATLQEATARLIAAANEAGGKDNVSVVMLRYTE